MPAPALPRSGDTARGFTLVELAIAMAVVALLAAIALPSYQSSVLKGRRATARAAILELLQQQERVMTQTGAYTAIDPPGATGTPFRTFAGDTPATASHLLAAAPCATDAGATLPLHECVRVVAVPTRADPEIGRLWMESTGRRGCEGAAGTEARACWR